MTYLKTSSHNLHLHTYTSRKLQVPVKPLENPNEYTRKNDQINKHCQLRR